MEIQIYSFLLVICNLSFVICFNPNYHSYGTSYMDRKYENLIPRRQTSIGIYNQPFQGDASCSTFTCEERESLNQRLLKLDSRVSDNPLKGVGSYRTSSYRKQESIDQLLQDMNSPMKAFQPILRSLKDNNERNAEACGCFKKKELRSDVNIRQTSIPFDYREYSRQKERDQRQYSFNLNLPLTHGRDERNRRNSKNIEPERYAHIKRQERDPEPKSGNLNLPLVRGKEEQNRSDTKNIGNVSGPLSKISNKEENEDEICSVCLDREKSVTLKPCDHKFCNTCSIQLRDRDFTCPLCRSYINEFSGIINP